MLNHRLSRWLLLLLLVGGLPATADALHAALSAYPQPQEEHAQRPDTPQQDEPNSSAEQKPDLSEQVIRDVLEPLQRGMEGHSLDQVLAIFDKSDMPDYAHVRDDLTAFFRQHDAIRFRYQVLQVASEKDHGFAVVEIDMAATPAAENLVPVERSTQMRFQMKVGPKGWKVVGFKPGDFFNL